MDVESVPTGDSFKRSRSRKPVYIRVVEQIRQVIKQGELAPGDQLLPERELAENLKVSRTSIRQALAVLEGMNIIEINPRDGAYVRQRSLDGALEPLTQVLFQEREQVEHMFEVRQIIETQAACLAAERRTEEDLRHLRELNKQFADELHHKNMAFDANMRFHLGIVEAAKNPLLIEIMGTILTATIEVFAKAREQGLATASNWTKFIAEHEQIIEAIAQKDAILASGLLTAHLDSSRKRVEMFIDRDLKKGI